MKFSKFFSNIQETKWYRQFLDPVIDEIDNSKKLLDVGTGSGKLIQILSSEKKVECIGVDVNQSMLDEAKYKLKNTKAKLIKIKADQPLPFENDTFDYVTICNVLFHLEKRIIYNMLNEVKRVLKENGKIIILTPTGSDNLLSLTKNYFSIKNISIYIWYYSTKNRGGQWTNNKIIKEYCKKHRMVYKQDLTFKGFAQLETITK